MSRCYNKNPNLLIGSVHDFSSNMLVYSVESEQPIRSWSRSCGVLGWWAGRRRGCLDSPDSQEKLARQQENLQVTLQRHGEVRRGPETGMGQVGLEVGRGLPGT